MRIRSIVLFAAFAGLVAIGCSSTDSTGTATDGGGTSTTAAVATTRPAPATSAPPATSGGTAIATSLTRRSERSWSMGRA